MNLPIVIVVTKVDLLNQDDIYDVLHNLKLLVKAEQKGRNLMVGQTKDDIVTFARNLEEAIIPVFLVR